MGRLYTSVVGGSCWCPLCKSLCVLQSDDTHWDLLALHFTVAVEKGQLEADRNAHLATFARDPHWSPFSQTTLRLVMQNEPNWSVEVIHEDKATYLKPLLPGDGLCRVGKPAGPTGHQPGGPHGAVDVSHGRGGDLGVWKQPRQHALQLRAGCI